MNSFGHLSHDFQHLYGFSSMEVSMIDVSLHGFNDGEGCGRYEDHDYDHTSLAPDFNVMSLQGAPPTYISSHEIASRQSFPISFEEPDSAPSRDALVPKSNMKGRKRLTIAGPHRCHICGTSFTQHKSLLRHQREVHHANAASSKHICLICNEEFGRSSDRDRHMKYQHNSVKVECVYCGQAVSERALRKHWETISCTKAQAALRTETQVDIRREIDQDFATFPVLDAFGSAAVINIWLITAELYGYRQTHGKLDIDNDNHLLELKDVALRTMQSSLAGCTSSNVVEIVASLSLFLGIFCASHAQAIAAIGWLIERWMVHDSKYECRYAWSGRRLTVRIQHELGIVGTFKSLNQSTMKYKKRTDNNAWKTVERQKVTINPDLGGVGGSFTSPLDA